jgi:hypothetical protein
LPASGSRYSGSSHGPSSSSKAITGTATRNTAPQWNHSISAPPTSGPMAAPSEKLAIHTPMAKRRCCSSWNMLRIRDIVDGASVAPAMPSNARVAISISALREKAASAEAAPKAAAPINSSRRRPMRSPSVPIVIRKPATMKP